MCDLTSVAKLAWAMSDLHQILSFCTPVVSTTDEGATVAYFDCDNAEIVVLSVGHLQSDGDKDFLSMDTDQEISLPITYALMQMCHQHNLEYVETSEPISHLTQTEEVAAMKLRSNKAQAKQGEK